MSRNRLLDWIELCAWLYQQPRRCAYKHHLPDHLYYLVVEKSVKEERERLALVFYSNGWGWRLRKDWREKCGQLLLDWKPEEAPADV